MFVLTCVETAISGHNLSGRYFR